MHCTPLIEYCNDGPEEYEPVFYYSSEYSLELSYWQCNDCKDGLYWTYDEELEQHGCFGSCAGFGSQCKDCDEYFCYQCQEGYFLTQDYQACGHFIDNCEVEHEDQPELLDVYTNGEQLIYVCPDCDSGFYWDWFTVMCRPCFVEGCETCDFSYCDECVEPLFLDANGIECRSTLENCVIPHAAQPELLPIDLGGNYYCPECIEDFYFDFRYQICRHCSDKNPHCIECDEYGDCIQCESNYFRNENGTCDAMEYENCAFASDWFEPCEECYDGFVLDSQDNCVSCESTAYNCVSCTLDAYDKPDRCIECPVNARLDHKGRCSIDNCYEYEVQRYAHIDEGIDSTFAQCSTCDDHYSPMPIKFTYDSDGFITDLIGGSCVECTYPGFESYFQDCLSCLVEPGTTNAHSCTECGRGKELVTLENENTRYPMQVCAWKEIDFCVIQNQDNGDCDKCIDGYMWDGKRCKTCDIEKCETCERSPMATREDNFNTCVKCEPGFGRTVRYKDHDPTKPQHICDYEHRASTWQDGALDSGRRDLHCLVSDLNNESGCKECREGYFFNALSSSCETCDSHITGCDLCSQDGRTCDRCADQFSLNADGSCDQHSPRPYEVRQGDNIVACSDFMPHCSSCLLTGSPEKFTCFD